MLFSLDISPIVNAPEWPLLLTFSPLCLAMLLAPGQRQRWVGGLSLLSLTFAWYWGFIQLAGLLGVAALWLSASGYACSHRSLVRLGWGVAMLLLSILLLLHLFPGFHNPVLNNAVTLSEQAVVYTQYLNLDKLMVGLILLTIMVPPPSQMPYIKLLWAILLSYSGVVFLALGIALQSKLVIFEPKIPAISISWLITNLFFTCFVEEVFFRGVLQGQLQKVSAHKYWPAIVVCASGALFGLAHLPAGFAYTLIATLTGTFYAYVYWLTRWILLPVLLHFGFNCVHFFLFTYPYLQQ